MLDQLSEEEATGVLVHLDAHSLLQVCTTCEGIRSAAASNEEALWARLVHQLEAAWAPGEDEMIANGGQRCEKPEFDTTLVSTRDTYRLLKYFRQHRVPSLPDALRAAADKNQQGVLKVLLRAKADPNQMADSGVHGVGFIQVGAYPLHLAAKRSHLGTLDILLEARADVDAADQNGRTGLMVAVASGQRPAVEWLLSRSASMELASHYGYTALHYAAQLPRPRMVEILLRAGAAPNPVDREDQTPLHIALTAVLRRVEQAPQTSFDPSGYGDEYCYMVPTYQGISADSEHDKQKDDDVKASVSALLEHNASIDHQDGRGRKPCDILKAKNRADLCTWFDERCTEQEKRLKSKPPSHRGVPACFGCFLGLFRGGAKVTSGQLSK